MSGQRGQAVLRGACPNGEPKWFVGRFDSHSSHRLRGARRGPRDDQAPEAKGRVKSLGANKNYDTHGFVDFLRGRKIVPHVAANTKRKAGSAIDGRTTRHESYSTSQRIRKRIEEIFGWMKTVGGFRKTRYRGVDEPSWRRAGWARRTTWCAWRSWRSEGLAVRLTQQPRDEYTCL